MGFRQQRRYRQVEASRNLANFGVICFNRRIAGGIEA
jgi:hypothetical protein